MSEDNWGEIVRRAEEIHTLTLRDYRAGHMSARTATDLLRASALIIASKQYG